jgi:hypothetical protein
MIDVRMNLDVLGLGKRIKQLVRIVIINDGTGTEHRGNYTYKIHGRDGRLIKMGAIRNWARKSKTPIKLLQAVINDAYPEKANG